MKTRFLAVLAAGLLLLGGCKKEADLLEADCDIPTDAGTVSSVLAKYAVTVQQFWVQPNTTATIRTAAGYTISVPAGLQKQNGQALSASTIQVRVQEVTKRSEMIFSHTPTISGGQLLESGGMFNIAFSQDNQPLQLVSNTRLIVATTLPSALSTTSGMQLFTGMPDSAKTQVGSWSPIQSPDTTTRITPITGPTGNQTGFWVSLGTTIYNYNARGLNWINCDRFVSASPLTTVQVQTAGSAPAGSTQVFLVFNALNSMLEAYPNNPGNSSFTAHQIPVGYSVTVVAVRRVASQLYFGKQTAIVATNQVFTPSLQAVTEAELVAEIQQL